MIDRNNGDQSVMDCAVRDAEINPVHRLLTRIEGMKEDYRKICEEYPGVSSVQMAIEGIPVNVLRECAAQLKQDCKYVEHFQMMQVQYMVGIYFTIWLYSPKLEVQTHYVETAAVKNV